jgi:hypothetical protein
MIMDLNELPLESDYDFLDVKSANPSYCTQLILETDGLGRKDQRRVKSLCQQLILLTIKLLS